MARFAALQTAFNAGRWSPFLDARAEVQKYVRACKTMTNFIPLVQGPATFRPGFRYVARTKTASKASRLIDFAFSVTQAYAIEMGNLYMRFFANSGSILESSKAISGATKANPGVLTITGHSYSVGQEIFIESVGGMTELNNNR